MTVNSKLETIWQRTLITPSDVIFLQSPTISLEFRIADKPAEFQARAHPRPRLRFYILSEFARSILLAL